MSRHRPGIRVQCKCNDPKVNNSEYLPLLFKCRKLKSENLSIKMLLISKEKQNVSVEIDFINNYFESVHIYDT